MYDEEAHERALEKALKFAAAGAKDTWQGNISDVTCTEVTLHGLLDLIPVKVDHIKTMVCGLGGGYSGTGLVCGAVSGAVIAIGMDIVGLTSNPIEARYHIEMATRDFIHRFEQAFGSTLCRQITGLDFLKGPEVRLKAQKMVAAGTLKCNECIAFAIRNPLPSEEGRLTQG
jgi:C_GCAxxG_C_C family probable redox protein